MKSVALFVLLLLIPVCLVGQQISASLPRQIDPSKKYLFYLHGAIVQEQGIHAVSADYGPYAYQPILDTLASHGFYVLSEVRPKDSQEVTYAGKLARQIDTLLARGVKPANIIVVGASLGAYIVLETAHLLGNRKINYVVMGLCNERNLSYFAKYKSTLCGNFLSIYESSDQKGSCNGLLSEPQCKASYRELRLTMGNGHGFLYQPYRQWVQPLVEWINQAGQD
jgi:hypothetical protein